MPNAALFLQILTLTSAGLAALRLFVNGLFRRYPALFSYLIVRVVFGVTPLFLNHSDDLYEQIYILSQPITWACYILMVRELYALVLTTHRGLATVGRWAMYISVVVSIALSVLSILPKITPKMPQTSKWIGYIFAIDRGVNLALVLFILLILFFLSRYPVRLSSNVVRHAAFLFTYFLSNTAGILLRTIYGPSIMSDQISLALAGVATLMILAWLFLITPAGEEVRKVTGIASEHEERILQQLESLNAAMLKISRS